jgi:uncharacterized membrane protein
LVYTLLAVPARAQQHGTPWTLDGAAWLARYHPFDWGGVTWLNAHVPGRAVIAEAPATQYGAYAYEGRISAHTGLPAVLGWAGHEWQWRGTYEEQARREQDLELLFTTEDPALTEVILERYGVEYVVVGPVERERYPAAGLTKFADRYPVAYANEGLTLYRVGEGSPAGAESAPADALPTEGGP